MKKLWSLWDEFWFAPRSLLNLACFRIVLCSTLFLMDFARQFDLPNFYSDEGLLPAKAALAVMPEFYRPLFPWYFWGEGGMAAAHTVLVVGLALLAFGMGGRVLNLIVWICHIGFLQRNYSIAFGADLIGGIFLLLMIGTQSCARLSVISFLRKKKKEPRPDLMTSMCIRMIQIQLCVIYFYTGIEKLKGMSWWDGTALWSVFANPQMVIVDLSWTRHIPLVVAALTFSTMLFEVYFSALIWNKKARPWVLLLGLGFHFGTGLSMALMNFAFVMLAPYVFFLSPAIVRSILHRIPGLRDSEFVSI